MGRENAHKNGPKSVTLNKSESLTNS